ncbi:MAG: tRNA-binding protein [Thermoanaerobaculia bacterium]
MVAPAPVKPPVSKDLLEKLDIRVGTIRRVEAVAASKKLVRLRVHFRDHERSILAGLRRERAHPEELIGRQALFVVNLETKIMAGERSEGMLLDIGYDDDIVPVLAVPETPVPDGIRAG